MLDPLSPNNAHEARESLLQIAGRRTQPIPSELVVEHVLGLPGPWDWPVRRAALEAVLRRLSSARTEGIEVVDAPLSGPWGRYRMVRADADQGLPYDVQLSSLSPLRGACDCADFTRGGAGDLQARRGDRGAPGPPAAHVPATRRHAARALAAARVGSDDFYGSSARRVGGPAALGARRWWPRARRSSGSDRQAVSGGRGGRDAASRDSPRRSRVAPASGRDVAERRRLASYGGSRGAGRPVGRARPPDAHHRSARGAWPEAGERPAASPLCLSEGRGASVPRSGSPGAGRRHGARQDDAGGGRRDDAPRRGPRQARAAGRPRVAQAAVGARVARDLAGDAPGRRRRRRRAARDLRLDAPGVPGDELRAGHQGP